MRLVQEQEVSSCSEINLCSQFYFPVVGLNISDNDRFHLHTHIVLPGRVGQHFDIVHTLAKAHANHIQQAEGNIGLV